MENAVGSIDIFKSIKCIISKKFDIDMAMSEALGARRIMSDEKDFDVADFTCVICFELYNLPRKLPCSHSFCEDSHWSAIEHRTRKQDIEVGNYRT